MGSGDIGQTLTGQKAGQFTSKLIGEKAARRFIPKPLRKEGAITGGDITKALDPREQIKVTTRSLGLGRGGKPPEPPTPGELPKAIGRLDPRVLASRLRERRRARAAAGTASTIRTSPLGVQGTARTTRKSLLGF